MAGGKNMARKRQQTGLFLTVWEMDTAK